MEKKFFKNTEIYNGCGPKGIAIPFSLENLNVARAFIIAFGGKIDSEKSRADAYKHAQWLIDQGSYTYYHDEQNGTPFNELPPEEQEKVGLGRWESERSKWSKWTPERILERDGWYEGEVYWFSIQKDNTYTYQLILKEGDWIFREFFGSDPYRFQKVEAVDGKSMLPYCNDWEEITQEEFEKI